MDPAVASLLRRQHGVASMVQLLELPDVTRGQIDGWAQRGTLVRADRGVLIASGAPPSPEAELLTAVLRAGPGARAVGPRVLALLGIRGFARTDGFGILVPSRRRLPTAVDFPVFRDPMPGDRTVTVASIDAPHPARAVIEMARFLRGEALLSAIDAARWERRPTDGDLRSCLKGLPRGYVPAARVLEVVASGALRAESAPERRLIVLIGDEFGPYETQVWVSPRHRVDGLLRRHNVVVEYQGRDHRTAAGRRSDRARDAEIRGMGYVVFHVHAEDLANPVALRRRLRRAIRRGR